MTKSSVKPIILIPWIYTDSFIIITDSFLKLVLSDPANCPEIIHLIIIRIQIDGLPHILLCPDKIVKIIFCDSAKVPRFIKIRLRVDSQIEILDRKYIVFIIQSTTPSRNKSIHPKLRMNRQHSEKHYQENTDLFHKQ
jgi:hypothetical protein